MNSASILIQQWSWSQRYLFISSVGDYLMLHLMDCQTTWVLSAFLVWWIIQTDSWVISIVHQRCKLQHFISVQVVESGANHHPQCGWVIAICWFGPSLACHQIVSFLKFIIVFILFFKTLTWWRSVTGSSPLIVRRSSWLRSPLQLGLVLNAL